MAKINVSGSIVIPNGPQFPFNQTLDIEAYEEIDITVVSGASDKGVDLPSGSEPVQLIAILSDLYAAELTYKINTGTTARNLDGPLLLIGTGASSLFSDAPAKVLFSNSTTGAKAKDAQLRILIGRDATTP
jgi:hypothetical protein